MKACCNILSEALIPSALAHRLKLAPFLLGLIVTNPVVLVNAQSLSDPGFETYAVDSGGFVRPGTGPWSFGNDAGVVEPPAPNSSTGSVNTWSATFAAIEGQQYASTYAGGDSIRQSVSFGAAGQYRVSAYAAAPSGSVTIPPLGPLTLGNGEFNFTLGNVAIGSPYTIAPGTDWSLFTADFSIPVPGSYQIGIRNNTTSPYFINYDAFQIQPVPEPGVWQLVLAMGTALVAWQAFRKVKATMT
jgi:hypothetical protein